MSDETETEMRGWRDAIMSLLRAAESHVTERPSVNLARAFDNFCRMRAEAVRGRRQSWASYPAE